MYTTEFNEFNFDTDSRLLNVAAESRRLRDLISDIEWNGGDASHLIPQYNMFIDALKNGVVYLPTF